MNENRYKLDHPRRMQEMTKKIGRPAGKVGRPRVSKEPFHFDNSAAFREHILSYNKRPGYCMRCCTCCGVGIGLMDDKEYERKTYTDSLQLKCKRCKKILIEKKVEPKGAHNTNASGFRINVPDGIVTHSGFDSLTIAGRIV